MQNNNFLQSNINRDYPFKYNKKLALVDFSIEVPLNVTRCFISEITDRHLYISITIDNKDILYAISDNTHTLNIPLSLYKLVNDGWLEEPIGYFILSDYLSYPIQGTYELLDCTYHYTDNAGIKDIYIEKYVDGSYEKIVLNPELIDGKNYRFILDELNKTIRVDAVTTVENGTYIKRLGLTEKGVDTGERIFGNNICIYSENFIHIRGRVFSTSILNSNLNCPVKFDSGLKGNQGADGIDGLDGSAGHSYYDDYYNPIECIGSCPCPLNGEQGQNETDEEYQTRIEECYGEYNDYCDFPQVNDGSDDSTDGEDDHGGGGNADCVEFIKVKDDFIEDNNTTITYFYGINVNTFGMDKAGPLNDNFAFIEPFTGVIENKDSIVANKVPLNEDDKYIIEFKIPLMGGAEKSVYYLYGFWEPADLGGYLGFNKVSASSDEPFKYCVDDQCKGQVIYDTIKFDSVTKIIDENMAWGTSASNSTWLTQNIYDPMFTTALYQSEGKSLYIIDEDNNQVEVDKSVIADEFYTTMADIPAYANEMQGREYIKVTIYDVDNMTKISDKPLFIANHNKTELSRRRHLNYSLNFTLNIHHIKEYRVSSILGNIGLASISGIMPYKYLENSDKVQRCLGGTQGVWSWNVMHPQLSTYHLPDNAHMSFYKNMDLINSFIEVFLVFAEEDPNIGSDYTSLFRWSDSPCRDKYFAYLYVYKLFRASLLSVEDVPSGLVKIQSEFTSMVTHLYLEEKTRVYYYSNISQRRDILGNFLYSEEILSPKVTIQRYHHLIHTDNQIDESNRDPEIEIFRCSYTSLAMKVNATYTFHYIHYYYFQSLPFPEKWQIIETVVQDPLDNGISPNDELQYYFYKNIVGPKDNQHSAIKKINLITPGTPLYGSTMFSDSENMIYLTTNHPPMHNPEDEFIMCPENDLYITNEYAYAILYNKTTGLVAQATVPTWIYNSNWDAGTKGGPIDVDFFLKNHINGDIAYLPLYEGTDITATSMGRTFKMVCAQTMWLDCFEENLFCRDPHDITLADKEEILTVRLAPNNKGALVDGSRMNCWITEEEELSCYYFSSNEGCCPDPYQRVPATFLMHKNLCNPLWVARHNIGTLSTGVDIEDIQCSKRLKEYNIVNGEKVYSSYFNLLLESNNNYKSVTANDSLDSTVNGVYRRYDFTALNKNYSMPNTGDTLTHIMSVEYFKYYDGHDDFRNDLTDSLSVYNQYPFSAYCVKSSCETLNPTEVMIHFMLRYYSMSWDNNTKLDPIPDQLWHEDGYYDTTGDKLQGFIEYPNGEWAYEEARHISGFTFNTHPKYPGGILYADRHMDNIKDYLYYWDDTNEVYVYGWFTQTEIKSLIGYRTIDYTVANYLYNRYRRFYIPGHPEIDFKMYNCGYTTYYAYPQIHIYDVDYT